MQLWSYYHPWTDGQASRHPDDTTDNLDGGPLPGPRGKTIGPDLPHVASEIEPGDTAETAKDGPPHRWRHDEHGHEVRHGVAWAASCRQP